MLHSPGKERPTIPRPGKEPTITAEAKAWLVSLACRKAKDLGYPHELWTTRLLARHAREHRPAEGHACLGKLVQGTVCKILNEQEVKPHKVRYYLERRDPEFKQKMAEVLCVYREVRPSRRRRRPQNKNRAMRWRLSPTMRSPAFRQLPVLDAHADRRTYELVHEFSSPSVGKMDARSPSMSMS